MSPVQMGRVRASSRAIHPPFHPVFGPKKNLIKLINRTIIQNFVFVLQSCAIHPPFHPVFTKTTPEVSASVGG
ncbi:hypothetical protein HanLR1_Chr11g0426461 [Helianthus annuus]|nr:hypothetical protein HanLR1_Chr11g0426461 [Helianthus annuus]